MMRIKPILIICLTVLMYTQVSWAEEKGGRDLRAAVQNPVGAMYSLPFKFNFDYGAPNGSAYFFNVNPVIPVTVGDWNLISRALIPAWVSVDGFIEGMPDISKGGPRDLNRSLGR
jgi:hypothetical protein